ncbi:Hypp2260 [Branchiostoma lanceolatum]|uniref:Hypp2260 protein n=1 Tax=Branchiostoma lanceolatum TaxID=7740 RepID=A0A8K0EPE0_BRALA|nr:Hypp2260 [Branchiostoma lanceolatum]
MLWEGAWRLQLPPGDILSCPILSCPILSCPDPDSETSPTLILGRDYTCYAEACAHLGLPSLHSRRSTLTLKFAKSLMVSEQYRHLLPPTRVNISRRQTRSANNLDMPKCRTERYRTSAIPHMARVLNTSLV